MRVAIDFDGTLTKKVEKTISIKTQLNKKVVERVNELFNKGNEIIIYTSRGMLSLNGDINKITKKFVPLIEKILKKNKVMYSKIIVGKLSYDLFVDDLSLNSKSFENSKNILVGKFGRKVIFDNKDFSSKGGHFEILGMIKSLKQHNKVFVFGDYDNFIEEENLIKYKSSLHRRLIDIIIVDNGVGEWQEIGQKADSKVLENTNSMIREINKIEAPLLYSFTDPRLWVDTKRFNNSVTLLHQNSKTFRGHQEKMCLLSLPKRNTRIKKEDLLVIIGRDNGRGDLYDKYITELRKVIKVRVYGNFDLKENKDVFMGEIRADCVGRVYEKAKFCFMIGIAPHWVTQKIIECMHYDCIPILYKYYDTKNLVIPEEIGLRPQTEREAAKIVGFLKNNVIAYKNALISIKNLMKHEYYNELFWEDYYTKIINKILERERTWKKIF